MLFIMLSLEFLRGGGGINCDDTFFCLTQKMTNRSRDDYSYMYQNLKIMYLNKHRPKSPFKHFWEYVYYSEHKHKYKPPCMIWLDIEIAKTLQVFIPVSHETTAPQCHMLSKDDINLLKNTIWIKTLFTHTPCH